MSETSTNPPPPNPYGQMARRHWAKWRPNELSQIPDLAEFFSRLGLEAEAQIDQLAADLAGDDPGGEGYLEKVGRLRMARATAESQVLRELILLPAEPGHPEYDAEQEQADESSMYPAEAPWLQVVMTEDHPNYHDLDDDPGLRKTYLQDPAAPTE
jgi:hypothetical protein